ncbi:MAG: hypothetical protein WBG92_08375 [Thiohalocapsa sp.]
MPSCQLLRQSEIVEQVHGMPTENGYRALIDCYIVTLADKIRAAALKAWQSDDQGKALQVLAEGAMANGAAMQGILAVADVLGADDQRVPRFRRHLLRSLIADRN